MTPRKSQRHDKKSSQSNLAQQVQPSDYESEASPYAAPPTTRSNTDLNFSVLKRYLPALNTILLIAPSAVIYKFMPNEQTWERADIEGTLFVCQLDSLPSQPKKERFCVVVLNRKGLENLIVEMRKVQEVEMQLEFLILRWMEETGERVVGFHIHAVEEDTRDKTVKLIQECWEAVSEKGAVEEPSKQYGEDVFEDSDGQFMGRSVTVNQLFGR